MNNSIESIIREIREHEAAGARPAVDYLEGIMGNEMKTWIDELKTAQALDVKLDDLLERLIGEGLNEGKVNIALWGDGWDVGMRLGEVRFSLRDELLDQLDVLAEAMSEDMTVAPSGPLSRDEVARLAMVHGIRTLMDLHVI